MPRLLTKIRILARLTVVSGMVAAFEGQAASLQVAPVTLDLTAPAQTSSIMLQNVSDQPVNVQIRVYKWTQNEGVDQLVPATDVVASPPATNLQPGITYTIRVARTTAPIRNGENSYRLLIDELPYVNVRRPGQFVNMVVRYSIPVFFTERSAYADLSWTVWRTGKKLIVEASNRGNRHAKVANLTVIGSSGAVSFGGGLNGYVLPGSTHRWTTSARNLTSGSRVIITAKGDDYVVNQPVTVTQHP